MELWCLDAFNRTTGQQSLDVRLRGIELQQFLLVGQPCLGRGPLGVQQVNETEFPFLETALDQP